MFEYGGDRSLMATIVFSPLSLLKVICVSVDGIVGQMHEQVVHVSFNWTVVFLGGEPRETLAENEDSQGVHSIDEDVDSHIEFEVVNQVRFVHITLYYVLLSGSLVYPFIFASEVDTTALAVGDWFYNKCFTLFQSELSF